MGIVIGRRQDEVGNAVPSHALQDVLDAIPDRGKSTFGKLVQVDSEVGTRKKGVAACACLGVAFLVPGQDDVANAHSQPALGKGEQSPSRPDLDVIGMGADRQDRQRPFRRQVEIQREARSPVSAPPEEDMAVVGASDGGIGRSRAGSPDRSGSQIIQGQSERWYRSSSWIRSLTVSAGDQ